MKIKITKEQQDLLNTGSVVITPEDETYLYLPFWYKKTEDEDLFEIISPEKLPEDLVKAINIMREYAPNIPLEHKPAISGSCWKILDKDGVEMSDNWAVTPRTYEKVKKLLDRLNVDGEYRPYTMVDKTSTANDVKSGSMAYQPNQD